MLSRLVRVVLLSALLLFIYLPYFPLIPRIVPHPVAAASSSFTLYGSILAPAGWSFTDGTETNPGPDLVVAPGASVTLSLFSSDTIQHRFCVDGEATPDFICQTAEPQSANFASPTTPVPFTFTANSTAGTYTYFCSIHGSAMRGRFVVQTIHDVAVTGITTSRNFAYNGVTANPVQVNVTAANLGSSTESFFVSAKGNTTLIGNQSITLVAGKTSVVSFNWPTISLTRGVYVLKANATKVLGETNMANNFFTAASSFIVRFHGDVNGDCRVDIVDLATVGSTFGKVAGQQGYNTNADLNNDGLINIVDLVIVAGNFGQNC